MAKVWIQNCSLKNNIKIIWRSSTCYRVGFHYAPPPPLPLPLPSWKQDSVSSRWTMWNTLYELAGTLKTIVVYYIAIVSYNILEKIVFFYLKEREMGSERSPSLTRWCIQYLVFLFFFSLCMTKYLALSLSLSLPLFKIGF